MNFAKHKYTWTKPFDSVTHDWSFIGPTGGLNFHAHVSDRHPASCGLEFHHSWDYRGGSPPDHGPCPLSGGPCWHEGTSTYAVETLWLLIEPFLREADHQAIFNILEEEYVGRFERVLGEEVRRNEEHG